MPRGTQTLASARATQPTAAEHSRPSRQSKRARDSDTIFTVYVASADSARPRAWSARPRGDRLSYLQPGATVEQVVALLGTLPFSHACVAPAGICTARLALNEIIASLPDTSASAIAAATVIYERGPDSRAPHDRLAVGFWKLMDNIDAHIDPLSSP